MSDPLETAIRMEKMYAATWEQMDNLDAEFVNLRLEIAALQRELSAANNELDERERNAEANRPYGYRD